jgi:hypothetical protein
VGIELKSGRPGPEKGHFAGLGEDKREMARVAVARELRSVGEMSCAWMLGMLREMKGQM